ncbi:hypothetical protein [Xanthomonas arboricola]|uniref:hypothetical protein n=1 Tax=Xanthomonas arboricola TaxID=56448 RepID=UPI001BAFCBF2|nr:hypothetical protein [Xanthomonas arboricola]MDN0209839.1 hypothetical protein [Xanthomonas arboricola pv. corylina]MDN0214158.1 hypothetical protein [Xanthomonas arboricola pv. corylina]QUI82297.1 hypothetical protein ICA18_08760 [Xanthomonas arboricola pv. corylina]UQQ09342.1 hypothetical protein KP021_14115 [Xanthomonas arboricola pv. corylina]
MKLAFFLAAALPLAGCAGHAVNHTHKIDDGGLPSAEVKAFERAQTQYQYRDARIEWDTKNCAVYEGIAPNGQRQQQPLTKEDGSRICSNP